MGNLKTGDTASALAVRGQVGKLLKAAQDGNLSTFKQAAKELAADGGGQRQEEADIASALADVQDANNRGPLCFAARGGITEICQYLLEELHLPVNPIDKEGETPLIHAARLGFVSTAEYLLDRGADPHASAQNVATAIHHAAAMGSLELIKRLLDKGVSIDVASSSGTPLIWAAGHGRAEAVKLLLERGADPNATTEEDNVTALLTAAAAKFPEIVELLVQHGADVTIVAGGVTALHVAAEQGDEEAVKCLIAAGADCNVTDEDDSTPIQAAAISGHRNIVELLLQWTTPLKSVPEWTADGLMSYGEQLIAEEDAFHKREAERRPKDVERSQLVEVSPERKKAALEAKARGTSAFKKGNFMDAVDDYTQANELDPSSAEILSNRSLCWIRLGQAEQALGDAQAARQLNPGWSKAYYREGSALRFLQRFDEAADAFYSGVKIDPENEDLINAFKEAVEAGKKFHGTT